MWASSSLAAALFAAVATALTPPGTTPSSDQNLTVAFGSIAALNGADIPRASTANAPSLGANTQLFGSYTLMMIDLDIPPANSSVPSTQRLHWMQPGLTTASTPSTLAGMTTYLLSTNTTAFAVYNQPGPPPRVPYSHRYVEYLLNTTNSPAGLAVLANVSANRANFDVTGTLKMAGVALVAANWFNVTNEAYLNGSLTTSTTSAGPSSTSKSATVSATGGAGMMRIDETLLGGVGALAVGFGLL